MNNRGALIAQAARGPVLLIVVGTLFALQQANRLPISRSWPLLIIVIGVMKLIERMAGEPSVKANFPGQDARTTGFNRPGAPPPGGSRL